MPTPVGLVLGRPVWGGVGGTTLLEGPSLAWVLRSSPDSTLSPPIALYLHLKMWGSQLPCLPLIAMSPWRDTLFYFSGTEGQNKFLLTCFGRDFFLSQQQKSMNTIPFPNF